MDDRLARGFAIGDHVVKPMQGRIVSGAHEVHVEPRAMDVLVALARHAGDTVHRDDLILAVWKHLHVSDEALSRCISLLRHALGDHPSHPRYLETIPKRGYRLALPVRDVGAGESPAASPSTATPPAPDWSRTNLALQPTPILERESELAELRSLADAHRLVTLVGTAGVGKTRLALEAGARWASRFRDGVWCVEFAPLAEARLVVATVAAVLGLPPGTDAASASALARRLADRELLLILDNCEHLVDVIAPLAEAILGAAPGVRMLATSQVLLGAAGEQACPIAPLAVPLEGETDRRRILEAAAVRLFVDRAREVDPRFGVEESEAAAVAALCRRLEGVPLAIEMAAARAPSLGIDALLRRLDQRLGVLASGRRTAPARQQTLRATLDWSFGLLRPEDRTVLIRLAVFGGGFTLDAASAVAACDAIDPAHVVDIVGRLVARSLVVVETHALGRRYRLLETTRVYAREWFDAGADAGATRGRHLDFFLALAEDAAPRLLGDEQGSALALLDRERENFLAAHRACDTLPGAAERGLRLANALRTYWIHRGGLEIGYRLAREALARPGAEQPSLARARALGAAAQLASCMGRHEEVQACKEEAVTIARAIGDDQLLAVALLALAEQAYVQGRLGEARRFGTEALALGRKQPGSRAYKGALQSLVELERLEGRFAQAERLCEESLALSREAHAQQDIVIALLNLASLAIARDQEAQAARMLLEALATIERCGSKPLGANALLVAAGLAAHRSAVHEAGRWFGAGVAQCEQIGYQREPADEAFLAPLIDRARSALGAARYAECESEGRRLDYASAVSEARKWIEAVVTVGLPADVIRLRRREGSSA